MNASLTWKGVGETAVGVILTGAAVAAAPESGGSSLAAIPIVFGVVGGEGVVGKGMLDTANGLNLTDNKSAAEGKEGMDLATNPASAAVLPFTGPKTAGAVGTVVSTAMGLRDLSQPPTGVADAINKAGSARDVFSSARQFVHQVVTNIQSWLSPVPVN